MAGLFEELKRMWQSYRTAWRTKRIARRAAREGLSEEEISQRAVRTVIDHFAADDYPKAHAALIRSVERKEAIARGEITPDEAPELDPYERSYPQISDTAEAFFEQHSNAYANASEARFHFTKTHLILLRKAQLRWSPEIAGAPAFDEMVPLTNDPLGVIGRAFDTNDEETQAKHFVELTHAVNHFFQNVSIEAGHYDIEATTLDFIKRQMIQYPEVQHPTDFGLTEDGRVLLQQDNITLLKQMLWTWDLEPFESYQHWPGPAINSLMPFGSSVPEWRIEAARRLNWDLAVDDTGQQVLTEDQLMAILAIHDRNLAPAIVMLRYGQIDL